MYCPREVEVRENDCPQEETPVLTTDFCCLEGESFFVRGLLELPIVDAPGRSFGIGLWSSLSRASFDAYLDTFNDDQGGQAGPWFGWISNQIPGFPDMKGLSCQVQPQNQRLRPKLLLEPTEHPLAVAQREGVTLDCVFDILAANGHDIRAALEN
jgi:hypothetical protein